MRAIWHLTMTEAGAQISPGWEVNNAFVVVAETPSVARQCAAASTIDEPADVWLLDKYSRCSKIGNCTNNRVANGVIVADNNAS